MITPTISPKPKLLSRLRSQGIVQITLLGAELSPSGGGGDPTLFLAAAEMRGPHVPALCVGSLVLEGKKGLNPYENAFATRLGKSRALGVRLFGFSSFQLTTTLL